MNPHNLLIAAGIIAVAFIITYTVSRISFAMARPGNIIWTSMLVALGLFGPVIFGAECASVFLAPPMEGVVLFSSAAATLFAHLLAMRKFK